MERYYHEDKKAIIWLSKSSTEDFWDNHWNENKTIKFKKINTTGFNKIKNFFTGGNLVINITKKFLPKNSTILEGGCGLGQNVFQLKQIGYLPTGVDYAPETVKILNKSYPDLQIHLGDVRSLKYKKNSFNGYWSLGVIEHFWNGYEEIASEMERVISSGGYLFITFPSISSLRKIKIKLKKYKVSNFKSEPDGFYQFLYDPKMVEKNFLKYNFIKVKQKNISGFKGLKDESPKIINRIMQHIFNNPSFLNRLIVLIYEIIGNWFTGHMTLLVLKKK